MACFRNAAQHLEPGGRFVVEAARAPAAAAAPGQVAVPFDVSEARHPASTRFDLVTQRCESHHYTQQPDGSVRYDVGHFRYLWPAECDLMAQLGMELESRAEDWSGRPFTSESEQHVSVWRKPPLST